MKDIMTDKAAGKPCGGVEWDKFNTANENRQDAYIDRRRWELKIDDIILHFYTHTSLVMTINLGTYTNSIL